MDDLVAGLQAGARNAPPSGIIGAVRYGRDKEGLIPLWAGEGDLPTPRIICEAAARSLYDGETFYTHERGIPELREALAAYYEGLYGRPFDPDTFFVTGSGMQAIQICLALVLGEGDEILVPTPAWPNVSGAATVRGGKAVPVPMREEGGRWSLSADDLAAAMTPRTRAIFINSPANPTGWTADIETLRDILALARERGVYIVADEIYTRFVWTGADRSASFLDIAEPDDPILYVNTFSKNWAMTGWRVGWIHAPAALRQALESLIQYSTSGVSVPYQRAGIAALTHGEPFVAANIARARRGREIVAAAFEGNNRITYASPDGAFYAFFKVEGLGSSREAAFRLIDDARVGTAPGTAFGDTGEGFVRVCFVRSADSLTEAMRRMVRFLESGAG
ncbi:pyridoxal phosphate-dependent aminotransferase [Acuticoccus sp. M5D2P5]|uniref:pyridoxal phosphate-dependent aminotransferase n=1 Tax=Acuticoccus kalidii TaxID=2910977 RepID=UPI001F3AA867|nr:pyridoxal phosphate-dependent aminotransferase [Acuticoccus kalidii]MCF3936434.1 pyridoxal phosphate-dependent aminotransferase [Acuticoccus kalidii]